MSENNLINAFTKGRSRLLGLARRLLENPDDAEDALQEAFSRLWPRAGNLRSAAEADMLATETVKNISIDQLRRKGNHPTSDIDTLVTDTTLVTDIETDQERQEQYRWVKRLMMEHLTPLQQRILYLREVEELEYAEIAQREDMQEAAVRKQLSRARQTIREYYNKLENSSYGKR